MLFTDTDSLTYEIKSEDVYEEFFKHLHLYDFSNFPKDSNFFHENFFSFFDGKTKDVSEGKMKGMFVGLKSKMYSIKDIDGKKSNAAKGVHIATEFKEYKETLFNKKIMIHKMKRLQSKKHKLGTYKIDKISLSCFDDKRDVSNDGVYTRAYFHKDFKKYIHTEGHK